MLPACDSSRRRHRSSALLAEDFCGRRCAQAGSPVAALGASGFSARQVALAERLEALAGESGQRRRVGAWLAGLPARRQRRADRPETIAELEANAPPARSSSRRSC